MNEAVEFCNRAFGPLRIERAGPEYLFEDGGPRVMFRDPLSPMRRLRSDDADLHVADAARDGDLVSPVDGTRQWQKSIRSAAAV